MKRFKCISEGKVQGVWYRRYVQKGAQKAGLKGYVRNLPDGRVESVVDVEDEEELARFKAILQEGSPLSSVCAIFCEEIAPKEIFTKFEVRA